MCILEVGKAINWELPIIATGGIRNGLDVAKALTLGANAAGIAHVLLKPSLKDKKATELELDIISRELRIAMFLVGADSVEKLSTAEVKYGLTE
jgi:isopentenyl-diphosphate delta-isomerase